MSANERRAGNMRLQHLQRAADRSRSNRRAAEVAQQEILSLHEEIQALSERAEQAERFVATLNEQVERAERDNATQERTHEALRHTIGDLRTARIPQDPADTMPAVSAMPWSQPGMQPQPQAQPQPRAPSLNQMGGQSPVFSEFTVDGDDDQDGTFPAGVFRIVEHQMGSQSPDVQVAFVRHWVPGQQQPGPLGAPPESGAPFIPAGSVLDATIGATLNDDPGSDDDEVDGLPPQFVEHRCYAHHQHRYLCFDWHENYARPDGTANYQLQTASGEDIPIVRDTDDLSCPICLEEYKEGDRILPLLCEKKHRFHAACVGRWHDERELNCPMCRQEFAWTLSKVTDGLMMIKTADSNAVEEGDAMRIDAPM